MGTLERQNDVEEINTENRSRRLNQKANTKDKPVQIYDKQTNKIKKREIKSHKTS